MKFWIPLKISWKMEHLLHNIFKYMIFQKHQKALLWSKGLMRCVIKGLHCFMSKWYLGCKLSLLFDWFQKIWVDMNRLHFYMGLWQLVKRHLAYQTISSKSLFVETAFSILIILKFTFNFPGFAFRCQTTQCKCQYEPSHFSVGQWNCG